MNILHHKSWHVRTKKNIERVRRDEENAKQIELNKEKRILIAEQESRIQLLKDKTQKRGSTVTTHVSEGSVDSKHINIFDDFSDKIKTTNTEHEKEVKDEKEKWETSNGLLMYLHKKDNDLEDNWYLHSHEMRMKLNDNMSKDLSDLKDIKLKKLNDPLEDMKRYLNVMKSNKSEDKKSDKYKNKIKTIDFVKSKDSMKKHKKKSKHKKKKKRKHKSSDSSEDSESDQIRSVPKTIEQLRAERLNREKVERERTRALLSDKFGPKPETVILDDRVRSYNSQFNPEIARQNLNDK